MRAELGYREADAQGYRFNLVVDQAGSPPISVALGNDSYGLQVADLRVEGGFTSEGEFAVEGRADIEIDLPGLSVAASAAALSIEHLASHDALRITLPQVEIDGYGQLEQAQLIVVFADDEAGNTQMQMLELVATVQWQDIRDRIQLDPSLPLLPLPPDDAEVTLRALWVGDQLQFVLDAALEDVGQLWRFIPEAARPQVDDARIEIELVVDGNDFNGELGLACALRLPDVSALLPAALGDAVTIETGDESGLIHLRFVEGESNDKECGLRLTADGEDVSGTFEFGGDFVLKPILPDAALGSAPPMMAQQLDRLLQLARSIDLSGTARLKLGIAGDNAWFEAECSFDRAGLELDLFDMLASATGTADTLFAAGTDNEIDLDIDVAVELRRISLSIGSATPSAEGVPFGFGMDATFSFAGQTAGNEEKCAGKKHRSRRPRPAARCERSMGLREQLAGRD